MRRIELLSPAGDLERLKYAIIYGADAVYIGGKQYSLRSMASNFTLEDIKEGCEFAHAHNAKVYVTCNMVMHESDITNLLGYLKDLEACGVDAIIASSVTILSLVKKETKMEAHVSTQQSISNSNGIKFLVDTLGVDRVVLARECSMENIKEITSNVKTDIEVFVEGAMCASISGRCMLSNVLTNRDANRGGCAQPCRWNYDIYQGEEKISPNDTDFSMASRDLSAIRFIPDMIEAGVASLKIEGRMKSLHYVATIVNAYRRCIDDYYKYGKIENFDSYIENLKRGENREISTGFFKGDVTKNEVIYNHGISTASHDFVGIIESFDETTGLVIMEQRNVFEGNREIEILSPNVAPYKVKIEKIYDMDGNELESARHPGSKVKFYVGNGIFCHQFDLVR